MLGKKLKKSLNVCGKRFSMKKSVFCLMVHFGCIAMAADFVPDIKHGILLVERGNTLYMQARYSRWWDIYVYKDKPSGEITGTRGFRLPCCGECCSRPLTPVQAALWWSTLQYRREGKELMMLRFKYRPEHGDFVYHAVTRDVAQGH